MKTLNIKWAKGLGVRVLLLNIIANRLLFVYD